MDVPGCISSSSGLMLSDQSWKTWQWPGVGGKKSDYGLCGACWVEGLPKMQVFDRSSCCQRQELWSHTLDLCLSSARPWLHSLQGILSNRSLLHGWPREPGLLFPGKHLFYTQEVNCHVITPNLLENSIFSSRLMPSAEYFCIPQNHRFISVGDHWVQLPANTVPYSRSHRKPGHVTLCSCALQPSYQRPLTLLFPSASAVLNWWQQTQAEALSWCSEVQQLEENVILLLKSTPLVQRTSTENVEVHHVIFRVSLSWPELSL